MAYIQPQVQVFQEFKQLPVSVVANLNAFVFGPNYKLMRYSEDSEKELISLGDYNPDADADYDFPNKPTGSAVDSDYVKLFMENVWALYASISAVSATHLAAVSESARNKLRAIPQVEDAEYPDTTVGVLMESGGYVYDNPALPESVYFTPSGGEIGGAWSRMADSPAGVASEHSWTADNTTLAYITKQSGHSGDISVLASDDPLAAGNRVQGPFGIVLDLDRPAPASSATRGAGLIVYEADVSDGNPSDDDDITISGDVFTFKTSPTGSDEVQIGSDARTTYDNLKAAVHAANVDDVYEVVHEYGSTVTSGKVWIIGNLESGSAFEVSVTGSLDEADVYSEFTFPAVRQPVVLEFKNTAGTASFTLTADPMSLYGSIDRAIDESTPLRVRYNDASSLSVDFDSSARRADIDVELGVTTLGLLRTALVNDSDIAAAFDIGELDAEYEDETVDVVTDETESPVTADWDVVMIPDAYRIAVLPNELTFATGNGYNNSTHFKTRGVKVGDRVRYTVTGDDGNTYEDTTQVAALEADTLASQINDPTFDINNDASLVGDHLVPHTGLDIIIAGSDNQVECEGSKTALYALDDTNLYYPGNYSAGVLDDTYTLTITSGGAVGAARCKVESDSGSYTRTDVPITAINWDDSDSDQMGMVYIGDNLWAVLHEDSATAIEFEVGDTYSFSRNITAPWSEIDSDVLTVGGQYTGPSDTTYRLKVVRGGVFDRTVNAIDGLHTPNEMEIDYSSPADRPATGQLVTVGGYVFEFVDGGSASGSNIAVDLDGSADTESDWARFVSAVNGSAAPVYASQDEDDELVHVRGAYSAIDGASITPDGGETLAAYTVRTMQLNPQLDFDANEWLAGDVDDEYILKCTQAGTLTNARFALTSLRNDNQTQIEFDGVGSSNAENLGTYGLSAYFDDVTNTPELSVGDYWVIKVNATRPRVQITDSSGIDQGTFEVIDNGVEFDVGLFGVTASFAGNTNTEGGWCTNGGLVTGDIFYIAAKAEADGPIKTLVLSDDLPENIITGLNADDSGATTTYSSNYNPSAFSTWLYLVQNAMVVDSKRLQSPPDYNWSADDDGITVYSNIATQDSDWTELDGSMPYLPVYSGSMYVEYRALLSDYADTIYSLSDISDTVTELGTVHPDNPLAQGVYNALLNSGDQAVYFMATPSDDLEGFSTVLNQAEKTDAVYCLAPLTQDLNILSAVEAHINDMSGEESKRWRIGFVGTELPDETAVYDATTFTPEGTEWLATVTDDPSVAGTQNTVVEITNGSPNCVEDVEVGDEVRINFATDAWGDETYVTDTVAEVVSNTKVLLETGLDTPITVEAKIEIWHPNNAGEIATAVAARSSYFGDRRMYHVFPSVGYMGSVMQTSDLMASALAGLVSSVPPQQGLTNITVTGFDDVPSVYSTYSNVQLNEMAAGGTFILMQDMAGGEVYVRHQVSTATADGNLLTTELSVTKNLDAISYYFANMLQPFIGRFNITDELLTVLRTQVKHGLNYLSSDQTGAGLLGPMVIGGDNTTIRSLEQHATLQDHVVIIVDLQLPLPMNVIQLRLVV